MITIEKTEVIGLEPAIRGMRNPLNSWALSDSAAGEEGYVVGEKDLDLMRRLRTAGTDHRKYLRMIVVYADIDAPFYWWKEYDTYKVGTVANSCSTMHKIHAKPFAREDFSCDHMNESSLAWLDSTIAILNENRERFVETKDKDYWWQMIQILPTSYNQKRTVMLSYEVLANQYRSRKGHKLDEWHAYCHWIESLPYSDLITGLKTDEA